MRPDSALVADWQLPAGVDRGLWAYLRDAELARRYDATLAGAPLTAIDVAFARRHFPRPGRLIDLGCGSGRLLVDFAERGYWTLGIDLSAEMLRVVSAKAEARGVSVHRLQANLVELGALADASFDYAACLFSTLGMIRGAGHRRHALAHVFRILRPGGVFVLHVHNRWFSLWTRSGRAWLLRHTLRSLLRRSEAGDCVMPAHDGMPALTLHLFTRREIVGLLRGAGFELVEIMPLSLRADGRLRLGACLGGLRAYGYLLAARKPA